MDRIEEWRVFVHVARTRSFVTTAKTLGHSPQAITRAVASLEARTGLRLLYRTTRSVTITEDGLRVLEQTKRVLTEFEALESREQTVDPWQGTVTLTAPVLFGQLRVMPAVVEMLRSHPSLTVRVLLLDRIVSLAEEGSNRRCTKRHGCCPSHVLSSGSPSYQESVEGCT